MRAFIAWCRCRRSLPLSITPQFTKTLTSSEIFVACARKLLLGNNGFEDSTKQYEVVTTRLANALLILCLFSATTGK
jgi:hypothetical protein